MKKKSKGFVLGNKLYTILKWILATAVAPTVALITGLGELYHFDTTIIVGTITLVATFLGALIGYSNYNYQKGKEE
jgi:putative Mn2+ efflux pump MntP